MEYSFSKSLNMKYRTRQTARGERLQTEDGLIYEESETYLLKKNNMPLDKNVHALKKEFGGCIVGVGK